MMTRFFLPSGCRFGEKQIYFFFFSLIEIFHYQMTCCFPCSQTRLIILLFASVCFPFHFSTSNDISERIEKYCNVLIQLNKSETGYHFRRLNEMEKQSAAKGVYPPSISKRKFKKNERRLLFVCLFILRQRFQSFPTIFPLTW